MTRDHTSELCISTCTSPTCQEVTLWQTPRSFVTNKYVWRCRKRTVLMRVMRKEESYSAKQLKFQTKPGHSQVWTNWYERS